MHMRFEQKHLTLSLRSNFINLVALEHNERFFHQILIKYKVLHGLLATPQDAKGSKNILNSAYINFFDFIQKNNTKLLVSYCANLHKETIKGFNGIPVFNNQESHLLAVNR
ncbi:hypothetical protein BGW39_007892 [Mortierella sp. 14UC]|nr:hypothetical protein BGW39_007892 [Mortierella sp. 14UC]